MNQEFVIQSEVSQKEKNKYHMLTHTHTHIYIYIYEIWNGFHAGEGEGGIN